MNRQVLVNLDKIVMKLECDSSPEGGTAADAS
jgi:hypothetical protein